MPLSRLAALTTVAAALITVTACGSSSGGSSPAGSTDNTSASLTPTTNASTSTASTAGSSSASASDDSTSKGPSPVNGGAALASTKNLLFVLEAVNPKIGTDKAGLVAKSKSLCVHIDADESESQLEAEAAKQFSNGSWAPSEAEAHAIVATVRAYGGC